MINISNKATQEINIETATDDGHYLMTQSIMTTG